MKRQKYVAVLAFALVLGTFAVAFVGCKSADTEPTYTVWATTMPYSQFSVMFGTTLVDNTYVKDEVLDYFWNQYVDILQDEWKHDYTEEQIYIWFLEHTFGQALSRELTDWLIATKHVTVAIRRGSQVHAIAK